MKNNLFIAIEGTDGSGKSTQAKMLASRLFAAGHHIHATFEPTTGHIGKLLREILKGNIKADQQAIAALFLADRLDHINNPADGLLKILAEGKTVISDRYYFSSYAYHSVYVDMDWVIACNEACAALLKPDVTIFIDVPPEVCMQRISANREGTELYETIDILTKVRDNYLQAFEKRKHSETIRIIDGNRDMDAVSDEILDVIRELMN